VHSREKRAREGKEAELGNGYVANSDCNRLMGQDPDSMERHRMLYYVSVELEKKAADSTTRTSSSAVKYKLRRPDYDNGYLVLR